MRNFFPNPFGYRDSPDVVATPPQGSPNVAATPLECSLKVVTSDNVSQIRPLVEPYTNVPPFLHSFSFVDDNDADCGDKKSRSKGVYRPSGISDEIKEYKIFKSKKDLNTTLSLISM